MRILKKAVVYVLVMCLCLPMFIMGTFAESQRKPALPTSAGIQALRDEFSSDVAPEENGYALDYCYYSPV